MSKSRKKDSGLGKSLIKSKKSHKKPKEALFEHLDETKDQEKQNKLQSIIDQNALNEFLQEAELSSKKYEAAKETKVSSQTNGQTIIIDMNAIKKNILDNNEPFNNLKVPRRPKWDEKTTPELLVQLENQAFLNWRRELATIEETYYNLHITPYEKNIEVWKQLWRVLEKSDVVVQIVDGRDPFFFRCVDLEKYVKELDDSKINVLLINKADLLNEDIRKSWNSYLLKYNINHIFFSAKIEQEKIDQNIEHNLEEELDQIINTYKIANRELLLKNFRKITENLHSQKPIITVGMVGYPNVGKSSVINVLSKKKLVGVAARPGKTKHFQTIFLEKDLMLCDCPGLVFPSASSTRAEMVCNGVLPIDNLKDYLSPVELLSKRIDKKIFENLYHIKIDIEKPNGSQILSLFAKQRGYFTGGSGLPDQAKVSKYVLKDFVNGKLVYCKLNPEYDETKDGKICVTNFFPEIENHKEKNEIIEEEDEKFEVNDKKEEKEEKKRHLDQEFFHKEEIDDNIVFDKEDILDLMEGKVIKGVKLNKILRRDIKHALKRGEEIDLNKILKSKKETSQFNVMGKFTKENFKNLFSCINNEPEIMEEEN